MHYHSLAMLWIAIKKKAFTVLKREETIHQKLSNFSVEICQVSMSFLNILVAECNTYCLFVFILTVDIDASILDILRSASDTAFQKMLLQNMLRSWCFCITSEFPWNSLRLDSSFKVKCFTWESVGRKYLYSSRNLSRGMLSFTSLDHCQ